MHAHTHTHTSWLNPREVFALASFVFKTHTHTRALQLADAVHRQHFLQPAKMNGNRWLQKERRGGGRTDGWSAGDDKEIRKRGWRKKEKGSKEVRKK